MSEAKKNEAEIITHEEVIELQQGMSTCSKFTGKLGYYIGRNTDKIKRIMKALHKAQANEDWDKEFKEHVKLFQKFCIRGDNNQPLPDRMGSYQYTYENKINLDKAIEERRKKNPELYKQHDEAEKEYKRLLNEPCDIELLKIKESELPQKRLENKEDEFECALSGDQIAGIASIIIFGE